MNYSSRREEIDRDGYIELFESLKARVQYRTRFQVKGIPPWEGIWLLAPDEGEES